jgi:hypothetical protein
VNSCEAQKKTQRAASGRKHYAFDEQLANYTATSSSYGGTNSELVPPSGGPSE